MSFADELRTWRKKTGLSQSEAAKTLGVSLAAVQTWETGKHDPMPLHKKNAEKIMRNTSVRYVPKEDTSRQVSEPKDVSEVARTTAIEYRDERDGRILFRISYVIEAGDPVRIIVRRDDEVGR